MGRNVRDAMHGLLAVTPALRQAHAQLVQMDSQFPEILVSVTKTPEILVEPNILIVLVVVITVQQIVQLASAQATDSLWLRANVPGVCRHLLEKILGTLCIGLHPVTVWVGIKMVLATNGTHILVTGETIGRQVDRGVITGQSISVMYLGDTTTSLPGTGLHGNGMEIFGTLFFAVTGHQTLIVTGLTTYILGAPTPALAKPALRLFKTDIAPL